VLLQVDISDPRFSAIYDNPLYNVDPSAPEFKRSKTMEAILEEKVKRRTMSRTDRWCCACCCWLLTVLNHNMFVFGWLDVIDLNALWRRIHFITHGPVQGHSQGFAKGTKPMMSWDRRLEVPSRVQKQSPGGRLRSLAQKLEKSGEYLTGGGHGTCTDAPPSWIRHWSCVCVYCSLQSSVTEIC